MQQITVVSILQPTPATIMEVLLLVTTIAMETIKSSTQVFQGIESEATFLFLFFYLFYFFFLPYLALHHFVLLA